MTYAQNKRDANEQGLIDLWVSLGCEVVQMDRHAGFDLLVVSHETVYIVEVKNPKRAWRLTDAEADLQSRIGQHYHIIQTDEEAMELVR